MSFIRTTLDEKPKRFSLEMWNITLEQTVYYFTNITDQSFGDKYKLVFRFSQLKNLHKEIQRFKSLVSSLPELPPTRSFLIWNRTNSDYTKIQQRRKQVQNYLQTLLNKPQLNVQSFMREKVIFGEWSKRSKTRSAELEESLIIELKKAESMPIIGQ